MCKKTVPLFRHTSPAYILQMFPWDFWYTKTHLESLNSQYVGILPPVNILPLLHAHVSPPSIIIPANDSYGSGNQGFLLGTWILSAQIWTGVRAGRKAFTCTVQQIQRKNTNYEPIFPATCRRQTCLRPCGYGDWPIITKKEDWYRTWRFI